MNSVISKDSLKVAVRHATSSGQPIGMVTVCLGRELATAVERFAESTCTIQIQEHLADMAPRTVLYLAGSEVLSRQFV